MYAVSKSVNRFLAKVVHSNNTKNTGRLLIFSMPKKETLSMCGAMPVHL